MKSKKEQIKILKLIRTCTACPSQWDAHSKSSQFYIRYRWGTLSVSENDKNLFYGQIGDDFNGFMNDEELINILSKNGFDFSDCEISLEKE